MQAAVKEERREARHMKKDVAPKKIPVVSASDFFSLLRWLN